MEEGEQSEEEREEGVRLGTGRDRKGAGFQLSPSASASPVAGCRHGSPH